ncbi:hypothetical protein ASG93_27530 [Paenibacillus sp. Soil787]|nr:hypothetical protein ASG93_27530 [Paenibacillus sp. Soil787]
MHFFVKMRKGYRKQKNEVARLFLPSHFCFLSIVRDSLARTLVRGTSIRYFVKSVIEIEIKERKSAI